VIRSGAGHDRIHVGGNGLDNVDGGLGDDLLTIDYSAFTGVVTNTGVYASRGLVHLGNGASVDFTGIERLDIRSGSGADDFVTRDGADTIRAGAGNDRVDARGGDDMVDGGAGADTLIGGLGRDTVAFDSAASGVTASLLAGGLIGTGDAAGDVYISFENLRGSGFDDILQGDDAENQIYGMAGDDVLYGEGGVDLLAGFIGNDWLDGGAGADIMIGSAGDDTYVVDDAGDRVDEIVGQGVDTVRTNLASYELGVAVENLVGTASTGQHLRGNDGANVITGGSGDDVLNGGYGADTLDGGAGTDKAIFRGSRSAYEAQLQEDGSIRLAGPVGTDGTDSLRNIELFEFEDGVFTREQLLNRAPTLAQPLEDAAATEDAAFSAQLPADAFSDPDGDLLAYTAALADGSALPTWLRFDGATRTFSGTPGNADVGALDLRVTATDALGRAVSDVFTLTIANVNDAPVVQTPLADQSTAEDAPFRLQAPASAFADIDAGDALTLTASRADGSALPAWLGFDPVTRTFSGTPANGDVGAIEVKLTAKDGSGAVASDVFTLTVTNTNDAPVVSAPLADISTAEDAPFSFQAPSSVFADVDAGDTLTFSASRADGSPLPGWLTFDAATRTFSGTPLNGDVGAVEIRLTATDASGAAA
jgi:Ca2+-binding RTX toxin-like protein